MPPDWFLSDEQINALKVDPLKKEIKRRGVIPKGKKEHLRVTLKQCVEKKMPIVEGVTKDMQYSQGSPLDRSGGNYSLVILRGDQRSVASSSKGHSKRSSETVASATRAAKKQKVEKQEYASTKRVVDDTSDFNRARLDLSFPHLPEPVDNEKRGKCCQLCRYASGKKYSTNISSCSHCNVTLCVWCFKPFHTLPSISAAKNDICAGINKRKGAKKEKAASKKGKGNFRNIK